MIATQRQSMTKPEMLDHLRTIGATKPFKPYQEPETHSIMLEVRRPARIADGQIRGTEIALRGDGVFMVWTAQKKKAKAAAAAHGLRVRLMDGEAELWVPAQLADRILSIFGARARRELTEVQRRALMAHSFKRTSRQTGVPAIEGQDPAPQPLLAGPTA